MTVRLQSFDVRVAETATLEELSSLFGMAMRCFGLEVYALGPLGGDSGPNRMYLNNWPSAWTELYAINGFAADDIVVDEARRRSEPFTWTEMKQRRPGVGGRIYAAAAEFNWHDGFVVPVIGPNQERGIVSLAGRRLKMSAEDRVEAAAKALATYRRAEVLFRQRGKPPKLSAREREALALVAQGKDDGEIGVILGVSRTTAHAHVERAKRRLGATTRAQAVALAVGRDLI